MFHPADDKQEIAFRYAVEKINSDRTILPRSKLSAQIEKMSPQDSFHASKKGKIKHSEILRTPTDIWIEVKLANWSFFNLFCLKNYWSVTYSTNTNLKIFKLYKPSYIFYFWAIRYDFIDFIKINVIKWNFEGFVFFYIESRKVWNISQTLNERPFLRLFKKLHIILFELPCIILEKNANSFFKLNFLKNTSKDCLFLYFINARLNTNL